ncbi:MAG TPA: response regulator [Candidatus Acidoferrales bacterium]|jgi:CheY-like chemotaxis protein|nr:response regulator [Candidatus Acidoferrales bacterium]
MPTVLIVDGDNDFRKQLCRHFNDGGFDACLEAKDGFEALDEVRKHSPDLVVLEFLLPDVSGFRLAQRLKTLKPDLPIFMMAALYGPHIEKKAQSCGIVAVFSKRDDMEALVKNGRAICGIE